jgi:hypothetical protein
MAVPAVVMVEVTAILTNQPLLGEERLPDWLRDLKDMYALDTYNDTLCVFRCIAVHRGARSDRCTTEAKRLARQYFGLSKQAPTKGLRLPIDELKKVEEFFKLGIRVYEPTEDRTWYLKRQPAHEAVGTEPMTIGVYNDHAFLITDIKKLALVYACGECNQRFTQACNLKRHAKTCTQGKTTVICPGKKVERPQ